LWGRLKEPNYGPVIAPHLGYGVPNPRKRKRRLLVQSSNFDDHYPPSKITFADMREQGVRGLLIYCADYRCKHFLAVSADQWP
jgi:hypothetical protein